MRKLLKHPHFRLTLWLIICLGVFVVSQRLVGKGYVYGWVENGIRGAALVLCARYVPIKRLIAKQHAWLSLGFSLLTALCLTRLNILKYDLTGITLGAAVIFAKDWLVAFFLVKALLFLAMEAGQRPLGRVALPTGTGWFACHAPALGIALITLSGLVFQWRGLYFPYRTSDDFLSQWGQIMTGKYQDIHALGHTIFTKVLLNLWLEPGFIVLVQIVMIALLGGLLAHQLCRWGTPYPVLAVLTAVMLCLLPASFYMYPWKDVPYTFVVGLATYYILRAQEPGWGLNWLQGALLGTVLAWVVLFRLNGFLPALVTLVYFGCQGIKRGYGKKLLLTLVCMALWIGGINAYGYRVLKAQSPPNGYSLQVFGAGIAAVVAQDGHITPAQYERIERILPVDFMKATYTPWQGEKLIWDSDQSISNPFHVSLAQNRGEVIKLYFELLRQNPLICLKDILYNTCAVWSAMYLFDNGTLMLVLAAVAAGLWGWGKGKGRWAVFLPIAANALSIAISTITNEIRYLLPTFALFVPLLLYVIYGSRQQGPGIGERSDPLEST